MALNSDQQRECREIAGAIIEHVIERHIQSCPHGTVLKILQAKFVGVCIGCSIAGGAGFFGLAKLFGG